MTEMTSEEIRQTELSILLNFADFCEKHGLRYFLAYGTLLGAVRHQGFIPWDDDIDVQMPRGDYNRLIEIFNSHNDNSHIVLISPSNPISRHSFVKIIDNRTRKIELGIDYSRGFLGVDIDVFPIDGEPDSDSAFDKWYKRLQRIYHFYTYSMLNAEGSIRKRVFVPLIKIIVNRKRLAEKAAKLHSLYPYETATYVGAVESCFNFRGNRVDKSCYNTFVLLPFEGYKLRAPIGYDTILTNMYRNYMELPPKEKQVTHHTNKNFWIEN